MGDKGKMFSTVEGRAWSFYKENGWTRSWHCEGCLPVTLFTLLMWDEIYTVPVIAAYLSPYQKAPLDLYGSEFYDNRKEFIEAKLAFIEGMTIDELADEFEKSFDNRINFSSIMPSSLPYGIDELKVNFVFFNQSINEYRSFIPIIIPSFCLFLLFES